MTSVDVTITGAGIAGLAMACALGRQGFQVAVLEAAPRPLPPESADDLSGWDRRVSALTPTTQTFLDELGVWARLSETRVGPYTDMVVWDAEGTGQIAFHAREVGVDQLGHIVENRLTIQALLAAVEGLPGIQCHWETPVTALEATSDGSPQLRAEDGAVWQSRLVIGADGARSKLRELAGFETRSWSYHQRAIVATVRLADSHQYTCWQAFLPTGPLALLPLEDASLCSIVWSLDDDVCEQWIDCNDQEFVEGLNQVMHSRGLQVTGVGPRAAFPLHQCHAIDYIQPGLALVADAAHSIHPLAGQGINLGLGDVRILAEELGTAREQGLDPGSERVLRRYQRRRKGENLAMMAAMEGFKRGFGSDTPLLRVARNMGLEFVDGLGPLKQWFARQALS